MTRVLLPEILFFVTDFKWQRYANKCIIVYYFENPAGCEVRHYVWPVSWICALGNLLSKTNKNLSRGQVLLRNFKKTSLLSVGATRLFALWVRHLRTHTCWNCCRCVTVDAAASAQKCVQMPHLRNWGYLGGHEINKHYLGKNKGGGGEILWWL